MNLQEIKAAVDAGHTVHWKNEGYVVIREGDDWYIIFVSSGRDSCVGLTHSDGVTLSGAEIEFFCPHFLRRDTLEMAYVCGLQTVNEAIGNVHHHAMQLWPYGEIEMRLSQLADSFRDVNRMDTVVAHLGSERCKQLDAELDQQMIQAAQAEDGAEHLGKP